MVTKNTFMKKDQKLPTFLHVHAYQSMSPLDKAKSIITIQLRGHDGVSRDAGLDLFCLQDAGLVAKFYWIWDSN